MKIINNFAFAAIATFSLSACGSSGDDAISGASVDTGSPTAATSVPTVPEKLAMLEDFQNSPVQGCSDNNLELKDDEGEFAGATVQLCQGVISPEEPYTILLVEEGNGQFETGSMIFYIRNHPHPLAYSEIKDMIFQAAGIQDEAEEQQFRSELSRFQLAAPNMPGNDYRPLHTASSGAVATIAANEPGAGWLAVKVTAPAQ